MPYELFIALRYLRAKRKQVMISVITVIAVIAVAAGVASLIIVLAMMTGFREEFQAKILSGTAHINLSRKDGAAIENYRELVERLQTLPHIRAASATLYQQVLIQGDKQSSGAIIKGADMSGPRESNEVFQFTVEGDAAKLAEPEIDKKSGRQVDGIIVGRDLADSVGLKIGEIATIVTPEIQAMDAQITPRYSEFRVVGLFESGLAEYDQTWAYISLAAAQRLLGQPDAVQLIQIKVDNIDAVKQIGREIIQALGEQYAVQDWQQLNAPIYSALSYEKYLSGVALLIVIGIAALNIITVLIMIVMEKQRDIAILKSMGATNRSVMYVFMIQGLMIGVIGMIIGIAAGAGFARFANARKLIGLPPGAYALDYLPFHVHAPDVIIVAVVSIAISFLSTVYPSWSAARVDPVEGLRYE
ncbi:MAG TPA: FtsX-like permease family protein [Blastocatellia bacterium]|nr:FtsX-like permease family protein [Blastocatellia bacterium]